MNEQTRGRLITAAALCTLLYLLFLLRAVTIPILIAAILAYILDPLVDRLEGLKIERGRAILLLVFIAFAAVALLSLLLVPLLQGEFEMVARKAPQYLKTLRESLLPRLEKIASWLSHGTVATLDDLLKRGEEVITRLPLHLWQRLLGGVTSALKGTLNAVIWIVGTLIIPLYLYYLLKDFDRFKERIAALIPPRSRGFVLDRMREVDGVLSAFMRGQMMVCLILAALYGIGLSLIGIDFAVTLGLCSGAAFVIPYLGTLLGVTAAALMALLQYQDAAHPLYVLILYGGVQLLEGTVITPRIIGEKVGLHPLAVIIAVITGGELFGFLGILLALPAAASLKVFAVALLESYRKSLYFNRP